MKNVIFNTVNAVLSFDQKEVQKFLICKGSDYDLDETAKLVDLISAEVKKTIIIPKEPNYFDRIAVDLLGVGKGSALCKTCNKNYMAGQLKSIQVGFGGTPLDIKREKKKVIKRLFAKKRKPSAMYGGSGYQCPEGHNLLTVITWKTF